MKQTNKQINKLKTLLTIPAIILLASCGGGSDTSSGTSTCDNNSVQGTYTGTYDITLNGNATTTGFTWQANIEGDTISFKSNNRASNPTITGTLQNCRYDVAADHTIWIDQICNAGEQFQMTILFNSNNAGGNMGGTCGGQPVSGDVNGNRI